MANKVLAPRRIFNQMLKYMVIPTFDLVIEYGNQGVIVVRRKIAPYKNIWALPGLRMYKGEEIDDTLRRIAKQEVGLDIDVKKKIILGQFVGKFRTENNRQDVSTGYLVRASDNQEIIINKEHFSSFRLIKKIPKDTGAMYKYYLAEYFKKHCRE